MTTRQAKVTLELIKDYLTQGKPANYYDVGEAIDILEAYEAELIELLRAVKE